MPRPPISPTFPTTATSTSSNAPLFPFPGASSPSPSSQTSFTRAQRTAEARTAFTASLRSAGAHLDGELKARATDLYHNAQVIEQQERDLRQTARNLRDENEQLEDLVREQKQSLLELGIQTRSQVRRGRELGFQEARENVEEGVDDTDVGFSGIVIEDVPELGTIGDIDDFLENVERDLLVLEETCRMVEDGEEFYTDEEDMYMGEDMGENMGEEEGQGGETIAALPSEMVLPEENQNRQIEHEISATPPEVMSPAVIAGNKLDDPTSVSPPGPVSNEGHLEILQDESMKLPPEPHPQETAPEEQPTTTELDQIILQSPSESTPRDQASEINTKTTFETTTEPSLPDKSLDVDNGSTTLPLFQSMILESALDEAHKPSSSSENTTKITTTQNSLTIPRDDRPPPSQATPTAGIPETTIPPSIGEAAASNPSNNEEPSLLPPPSPERQEEAPQQPDPQLQSVEAISGPTIPFSTAQATSSNPSNHKEPPSPTSPPPNKQEEALQPRPSSSAQELSTTSSTQI